jgi:hypothetical protein
MAAHKPESSQRGGGFQMLEDKVEALRARITSKTKPFSGAHTLLYIILRNPLPSSSTVLSNWSFKTDFYLYPDINLRAWL